MTAGGERVHESYEIRCSTIPIDLYRPRTGRHRLFVGVTILTSSICREDHIYHICDTRYWNSSDCVEKAAASGRRISTFQSGITLTGFWGVDQER